MIRFDFTGKTVLVTGSSRGMGAAILEAFAAAGATSLLHYFNDAAGQNRKDAEELAGRLGGKVHLVVGDVRDAGQVQELMKKVQADHGGLDVLVNNAGVIRDRTVKIDMTLTAPGCPVAGEMPGWVQNAVSAVEGISDVEVNMVFDPPWTPDRMSEEARVAVGWY